MEGRFLSRPNRFIAHVEIGGKEEIVHVKNTGRCKELLIPGVKLLLDKSTNPLRKTQYDLVSVYKGQRLINMDSQAPNKIAREWLSALPALTELKAEQTFRASRFDFAGRYQGKPFYLEVKGVTLEKENIAYFPDAPTERGVKHIMELIQAKKEGFDAALLFVVQMEGILCLRPNRDTHPAFADALQEASRQGVKLLAYGCKVAPGRVFIDRPIPIEFV